LLIQMIEHPNAHGECTVFLDDMRVQARKCEVGSAVEEIHQNAPDNPA